LLSSEIERVLSSFGEPTRTSTSRLRAVSSLSVISAPPSASRLTTRCSTSWYAR